MNGIIPTDSVLLDGERYVVSNGFVLKRRVFPELAPVERTNIDFPIFERDDRRERQEGEPVSGSLHPVKKFFTIDDFSKGSGLYVDHGRQFSRRAYMSTLNHTNEGLLVLGNRRQQVTLFNRTHFIIHYRNNIYLLTDVGLYVWTEATNTVAAVAGTPTTPMYHACIHREFLILAGSDANEIVWFNGTTFANDPSNRTANMVVDLKERLFAVTSVNAAGLLNIYKTSDEGVTWTSAILEPNGSAAGIPTPFDGALATYLNPPTGVVVAPSGDGIPRIHVATPSGVWIIDEDSGEFALLHDMSHDAYMNNGKLLIFWPSTRKLYVNERTTLVEINPQTGEAKPVGPDFQAGPPPSVPTGFPTNFRPDSIVCGTNNSNFLYLGTMPVNSSNYSLTMKMDVEGHWYFETRGFDGGARVRAMHYGGPTASPKLYFIDDKPATTDTYIRFLESDGDYGEEGEIETPWLTFGFPDITKCIYSVHVEADQLSATELVALRYRKDYDENIDYALTNITSADTRPYVRNIGVEPDLGSDCNAFKLIIKLDRLDGTPTVTPRVFRVVLTYRLMPPPLYEYEMELLFGEDADDPNRLWVDKIAALTTLMEDSCSFGFTITGNPGDTPVAVIPKGDTSGVTYEQLRETRKQKLVLIEVAPSEVGAPLIHVHTLDSFTGDTSEVDFTLTHPPSGEIIVFLDDTYQIEGGGWDFTRSGQQITFATAPGLNAIIRVHYPYLT